MIRKLKIKLTALLLTFTIVFTTIPVVAMAKQTSAASEKPAYIVGEIESLRTETEKVFKMSDGKMQMAIYNAPVHFENENGEWEEINNKLKSKDNDAYTTKNTSQDISLSKNYKKGKTVEIITDDANISWGFIGANNSKAQIIEPETDELEGDEKFTTVPNAVSTTVYGDIYENIDAEYIITGGQVKENLVLNKKTDQNEFEIEYRYKKLTPVQIDDKTIQLQNSKGKTIYTITAPIMTDDNGAFSDELKLEIVSDRNNKLTVKLIADKEWLQDSDRNYPVTIDPSVESYQYDVTYQTIYEYGSIGSGFATTYKNSSQPEGYQKGYGMACVNLLSFKENAYITSAKLNVNITSNTGVYIYDTDTCTGMNYIESGLFKNAYPLDHYEYDSNNQEYSFDITKTFNQHVSNNNSILTYVFRADDETDDYEIRVFSSYASPVLTINYIDQNGINDKLSYHSHDISIAGTGYLNDKTGYLYLQRNEFSVDAEDLPVTIKMTYTGNTDGQIWVPSYFHTLVKLEAENLTYYRWVDDTQHSVYFYDMDEDDSCYIDDNDEGYKLYASENKITTPEGDVYIFDNVNSTIKRLVKQTTEDYIDSETNTYSKAIEIDYNSSYMSINTITDGDGNVYSFTYEDGGLNPIKISCGNEEVNYSYVSNSDYYSNLVSATYNNKTSTYSYNSNNKLIEAVANSDYKITYDYINENSVYLFSESGYDAEDEEWVKGSEIQATYYPAVSVFWETSNADKTQEVYTFDKKGYLQTIVNNEGYAISRVNDENGDLLGSTDITVPVINLIDDSSFEDDTDNSKSWNGTYSVEVTNTNNHAVSGNQFAKITDNYITKTIFGLEPGVTYTLSAYVKSYKNDSTTSDIQTTTDSVFSGIGARVISGTYSKKSTGISGKFDDWTRIYVTFEVPENTTSVELQIGLFGATGELCVDACQLEKHKTAYNYNIAKNGDFDNNNHWTYGSSANIWGGTAQSEIGGLSYNFLRLDGVDTTNIVEQELDIRKAQLEDLSISAWIKTEGMLPRKYTVDENGNQVLEEESPFGQISLVGIKDNTETYLSEIEILNTAEQAWYLSKYWYKISGIVDQDRITTDYDSYKLRIEYNHQQGYLYVDGVEVMSGVMSITEDEDTTVDSETEPEIEQDDYQIEDGYTIVSTINNFDTYTGNADCSYLVNGTVVNTTNEDGENVKDETNSTAYLGNSWGITQNKDKYEYTDSTGATKTIGGIWIGGKLDKTTQSGIRFWYKSTASWTVQLRSATYGKGSTYDYIKTLPAAPNGTWATLLYRNIENSNRAMTDFKYLFVKVSSAPVYIDEVQTVLQDSLIYEDKDYNIADITQEQNYNYPVTDEYVYNCMLQDFEAYTPDSNIDYFTLGSDNNAYSGKSFGVTANKDKYQYTKDETTYTVPGIEIIQSLINTEEQDGIRFWYKSSKGCEISLRERNYGYNTDYKVSLSAAPNGSWYTILFDDIKSENKDIKSYTNIFIKTADATIVYIDDIYLVKIADEYYQVSENYETSRDGQTIKTVSSSKDIKVNSLTHTVNRETNSLGVNSFTTTDEKGNQISATDGNGNTVNYSYDDLNNLVEMAQTVNTTNLAVNYTYDNRGQISTITNGNVTYTYKYTPFGELKSISVGSTPLVTYNYKSNQNRILSKVTYANGQTLNYVYDDNYTLLSISNKTSDGTVIMEISYVNDEIGNSLKTINSENETVTLTYFDETQIWNLDETEILYLYSADDDNFDEYVNGTKFTTTYSETDNTDEKTSLTTTETTAFGDMAKTVYSDAFGRTIKEETKSGNKLVLLKEYEYNSNGEYTTDQIKSVTTTVGSNSPVTVNYTYDNNGNLLSTSSYPAHRYRYDEFNQVIYEYDGSQWLEYTYDYDNGGNITSATGKSYTYGDNNWVDKLTAFNGQTITYDENGNPTSYLGATLTWENGRQLASFSDNKADITYEYNAEGLRTKKVVNGVTYKYQWSEHKLTHQAWGNQSLHFFYDINDEVIGFTYYDGASTQEYIYNKNTQGDVIGIIDSNGTTVANYSYDALGYCTQYYGVYNSIADINPIRYRGYYYDEEIEMYYLQSRYYDYNTGRFINADAPNLIEKLTKQNILGTNIFAYCSNNYIVLYDKTGEAQLVIKSAPKIPKNCKSQIKNSWFATDRYGKRNYRYPGDDDGSKLYYPKKHKNISIYTYGYYVDNLFSKGEFATNYIFYTFKVSEWKKRIGKKTKRIKFNNDLKNILNDMSDALNGNTTGNTYLDAGITALALISNVITIDTVKNSYTVPNGAYIDKQIKGKKDSKKVTILIGAQSWEYVKPFWAKNFKFNYTTNFRYQY